LTGSSGERFEFLPQIGPYLPMVVTKSSEQRLTKCCGCAFTVSVSAYILLNGPAAGDPQWQARGDAFVPK
jgi:hypothetical protein